MGALRGIRVVGFTHYAAGPYCLSMMGDHGADVVNIEPLKGEEFRDRDGYFDGGESSYFLGINRSKRSIALDLKNQKGREIAERLVLTADVMVSNYRAGTLERAGLGYDRLLEAHPRLVGCLISAWGTEGPIAHLPGMDMLAQARSGLMGITGHPDSGPVKIGAPISDYIASYLALNGILMALRERDQSGKGQLVTVSLLDGLIASLANLIPLWQKTGEPSSPTGNEHPQLTPYGRFPTADSYLIIGAASAKFWEALCKAIDRAELLVDHRYRLLQDRLKNRKALEEEIASELKQKSTQYWLHRLQAAGIPCAPVNSLGEALQDSQVVQNKMVRLTKHPVAGDVLIPGIPIQLSRTPGEISRTAALLGEHTRELLVELGYTDDQVEELHAEKVIAMPMHNGQA